MMPAVETESVWCVKNEGDVYMAHCQEASSSRSQPALQSEAAVDSRLTQPEMQWPVTAQCHPV
jgi:hypothetical protein